MNYEAFRTAGLADAFDLEEFGTAYATAEHVAEFLLAEENDALSPHDTEERVMGETIHSMRWFARAWREELVRPTRRTWMSMATDWRKHEAVGDLIDWSAIDDHAMFVEQVFCWMIWKLEGRTK